MEITFESMWMNAFTRCQPYIIFVFHAYSPSLKDWWWGVYYTKLLKRKHSSRLQLSIRFTPNHSFEVWQDWYLPNVLPQRDEGSDRPCIVIKPHRFDLNSRLWIKRLMHQSTTLHKDISHVHRVYDYFGVFKVLWVETKIFVQLLFHRVFLQIICVQFSICKKHEDMIDNQFNWSWSMFAICCMFELQRGSSFQLCDWGWGCLVYIWSVFFDKIVVLELRVYDEIQTLFAWLTSEQSISCITFYKFLNFSCLQQTLFHHSRPFHGTLVQFKDRHLQKGRFCMY